MIRIGLLAVLVSILLFGSIKDVAATKKTNIDKGLSQFLHQDSLWLALGHYQKKGENKWLSEINDVNFFLSKDGKTSPDKELKASINMLKNPSKIGWFKCNYPARYQFLSRKLKLHQSNNFSECNVLNEWIDKYSADSISMIYPSSFLSNPSSIFGHTFLRFDKQGRENNLSYSVDFSAKTPSDKNVFSYIKKGLTGGYKGFFSIKPYYIQTWKYSDIENRKIWEYKLKFTKKEIQLIFLHLWELRGSYIDYYFVDENCSYQILSLLSIISSDLKFREEFSKMTIPSDTVRFLDKKNYISSVSYLSPPIDKLQLLTDNFSEEEIKLADDLINRKISLEELGNKEAKKSTLQAATSLLHYKIQTRSINQGYALNLVNAINKERIEAINKTSKQMGFIVPIGIEKSHPSSKMSIALFNLDSENYLRYSFSGGYHGLDDLLGGFSKGIAIEALKFSFMQKNDNFRFDNFTFLSLASMVPDTKQIEKISWDFELSSKRIFINPVGEVISQIDFSLGKTISLSEVYVYVLANTGIAYNSINGGDISLTMAYKSGLLYQGNNYTVQLEWLARNLNSTDTYRYKDIGLDVSVSISKDMAMKFSANYINSKSNRLSSYELGLLYYF